MRFVAQVRGDQDHHVCLQLRILPAALHHHSIAHLQISQLKVGIVFGAKAGAIGGLDLHIAALLSSPR